MEKEAGNQSGRFRKGMVPLLLLTLLSSTVTVGSFIFFYYITRTLVTHDISYLLTVFLILPTLGVSFQLAYWTFRLGKSLYERSYFGTRNYLISERKKVIRNYNGEEQIIELKKWEARVKESVLAGYLNESGAERILKNN